MIRHFSVFAVAAILAGSCQLSLAQTPQQWQAQLARMRQQQQQQNIQWENTDLSGNIKGVQGALLQVAAGGGENWLVQIEARPQDVVFQGAADPAFVKAGMLVEFKSKVNKRGQASEPVQSLTIFTVREGRGVGVQADGGAAAGELFSSKPDEPEKKGPKAKAEDDTVYHIAGQITKLGRTGDMTINCAGTTIKADLAKDAKVAIDVNHLQFAQIGDKVDLRARYPMGQKAAGQGLATQITVTGLKPLGEPKKRVLPGTKADDEAAPAEGKPAETKKE